MKKKYRFIYLLLAVFSFFVFESCEKQGQSLDKQIDFESQEVLSISQDDISVTNLDQHRTRDNTISLATFNAWNTSWKSHWNDRYISNFTMSLSNLQNILNTPEVAAARLYFGYSEDDGEPHLILVGVNAQCESMIGANDYIYNVTQPCPSSCANEAPTGYVFPPSNLTNQPPPNTISLATFNTWNTNWVSHWDDNYIECFTTSLSNLQNIVNTNGAVAVRFYLGYSEIDNEAHMTLVGVDDQGYSMVGQNTYIYNRLNMSPPRKPPQTCDGIF